MIPTRPRPGFTLIELLVVIAIIFIFCGFMFNDVGASAIAVGAGWFFHLRRLMAEQTLDVEATIIAVAALVLLVAGIHVFARSWQAMRPTEFQRPWRLRWSVGITLGVALFAAAGIAGVGLVHQTFWLTTGPPIVERGTLRMLAARVQSSNNLKQIGLGAHAYLEEKKVFPPGTLLAADGQPLHGWGTLLLPYVDQQELAKKIHLDLAWTHAENQPHFTVHVPIYALSDRKTDGSLALCSYAANVYVAGTVPRRPADVTDGLTNTLFYGEAAGNYRPWGHPCNWRDPAAGLNRTPEGFGHQRKTGVVFVMGDGSARTISDRISPEVLKALASPAGGETVDTDMLE
jgi:hypothetical protein